MGRTGRARVAHRAGRGGRVRLPARLHGTREVGASSPGRRDAGGAGANGSEGRGEVGGVYRARRRRRRRGRGRCRESRVM